jgi:hypothetical protein
VIKGRLAQGVQELLVWWDDQSVVNATWGELQAFKQAFPSYQLKDALVVERGGGDVMIGVTYQCRRRKSVPEATSSAPRGHTSS